MEKIIVPDKITTKEKTDGKKYLSIKAKDGKTYNIFDLSLFGQFEEGIAVKLIGEMSDDDKYFNTNKAERVNEILKTEAIKEVSNMIDDIKNRSVCLSYAKDIAVAEISKGENISVKKIIDIAKEFYKYIAEH